MLNTEYMYSLGAPQRLYSLVFVFTHAPLGPTVSEYGRYMSVTYRLHIFWETSKEATTKAIYTHESQTRIMLPNSASSSFMSSSRLGLSSTAHSSGKKRAPRKAVTGREGPLWDSVTITRDHDTSPQLTCNNCGATFCGGATRIRTHVIDKCKGVPWAATGGAERVCMMAQESI